MSAQILDLRMHRPFSFVPRPVPELNTMRAEVDERVRNYALSLGLCQRDIGASIARALIRLGNCADPKNAVEAGKNHANVLHRNKHSDAPKGVA